MLGRFELHCHTYFSRGTKIPAEGIASPEEVVRRAKEIGLAGIAITDHNTIEGLERAAKEAKRLGIVFIPGIEIDSVEGHIIALGVWKRIKPGMSAEKTVAEIHRLKGLAVAVHPYDARRYGVGDSFVLADAVEVFNSMSIDKVSNGFMKRQAKGTGMSLVAGSDAHSKEMIGFGTVLLDFEGGYRSVLSKIKMGNVAIDAHYVPMDIVMEWVRERMIMSYSEILRYIHLNYNPVKAWLAKNMLRRYVVSRSGFWKLLGRAGVLGSSVYTWFRILSYR